MGIECQVLKQVVVENQLADDDVLGAFLLTLDWLRPVLADYLIQSYGPWDEDDRDDVVAQTVVTIMEAIQEEKVIRSIVGFAQTVARAQAARLVMAEERQKRIATTLAEYQSGRTYSPSAEELVINDEEAAEQKRRRQVMQQVIADIDDATTKELLKLRLEGLLLKEIAPRLGLSVSATRARYWRVQKKIRADILAYEAELPTESPWLTPAETELSVKQVEQALMRSKMKTAA